MDFSGFLTWLALNGGAVMAASWILERVAWFQNLASQAKQYVFFGVAAVLGVGAYAALVYIPANIMEQVAPYFGILAAIFTSVFLGNAFHLMDKQGK